jgi:F420-non-reducing hydrogenase iron-sulfur subunit
MDSANVRVHVFCCSTSLQAADLQDAERSLSDTELKVISLPCSGKVNMPYLVKAFESGAHGVMVVTCKKDDCRYIQGSFRAKNRVQAVDELIAEIGLGRGRIMLASLDDDGVDGIVEKIRQFRKRISTLPAPDMKKVTC